MGAGRRYLMRFVAPPIVDLLRGSPNASPDAIGTMYEGLRTLPVKRDGEREFLAYQFDVPTYSPDLYIAEHLTLWDQRLNRGAYQYEWGRSVGQRRAFASPEHHRDFHHYHRQEEKAPLTDLQIGNPETRFDLVGAFCEWIRASE